MKKILKYIINPVSFVKRFRLRKLNINSERIDDFDFIKRKYRIIFGKEINLKNPITFNEKINWLKLNYRNPDLTRMVDKFESKIIVSKMIGPKFVAKNYGVWDDPQKINFDKLPNSFVLKTTHDCGGVIVVKDKTNFDKNSAMEFLKKHLSYNYYWNCREWPYKNIAPRVIAEEFLSDNVHDVLPVFKFFCFGGIPKICQVITDDKKPKESIDYFDMSWNLLNLRQNYPNSKIHLKKPNNFEFLKEKVTILAQNFPFVRVDVYPIGDTFKFSEFTFFSDAGFAKFHPKCWDYELGKLININKI